LSRSAAKPASNTSANLLIASAICLVLVIAAAISFSFIRGRKQQQASQQRREQMAKRELDLYAKALELFHSDFGRYPTMKEGLSSLHRNSLLLANWRGPYIEKDYVVDPWGNEYVYRVFNEEKGYELFTYGPEGEVAARPFLRVNFGEPPSEPPKR
jgi:type II secretion system protein G